ncbi:MAG: hypothetical protein NXI08_01200 [bacterium]|jgi:hypothetical protein|nr:hypothetical protein [bacterium]
MIDNLRSGTVFSSLLAVLAIFVPVNSAHAQSQCVDSGSLSLEVNLSPVLENASVLGLTSLGIDTRGSGPVLVSGTLVNNTDELLTNLFFEFKFTAGQVGTIAELTQQAAYPFTLDPRQVVYATNNDIDNEQLPGVDEKMKFDGGLTSEGEDFLESLDGTTLPNDIYTINAKVSQVTNACGKQELANVTVELGGTESGAVVDELSIFLKTPGDEVGSDVSITNQYPQLSWEGDANNRYRVIVVNDNGQDSPESLIEGAKSTAAGGADFLQFEYLDVNVEGNNLQYPSSGAQALVTGERYFWQVSTVVQTALGTEEYVSDIWTFSLVDPSTETSVTTQEIDEETLNALITLIGDEEYNTMLSDGFYFESIEVDQQVFSGITGIQKLTELLQKLEDGDIIISDN